MRIFMPCKNRTEVLRAAREALEHAGHSCTLYAVSSAEKLRETCEKGGFDLVLGTEGDLLAKLRACTVPKVYLASDFFCGEKLGKSACDLYLIPHATLAFDFITAGAREKNVQPCGIPVASSARLHIRRDRACRSIGLAPEKKVFTIFTDGVNGNEVKSTVRAVQTLCPQVQTLVMTADTARQTLWQSAFAPMRSVYVTQTDPALGLSVCDAVFLPASASVVCAAARQEKVCVLLHAPTPRCRKNAAFLDTHGAAFCGKTASDNVSYAKRLLEGQRLRGIMLDAQEKCILSDAEPSLVRAVEQIAESRKNH